MLMTDAAQLRLADVLDPAGAATLTSQLVALRGQRVVLDASAVERVGGLGLQVLLSARATWEADGRPFAVVTPSVAFQDAVALSGARPFDCLEDTWS